MINLLPPATKSAYQYARRNRTLVHWLTACVLALAGAAVLAAGGYLYLDRSIADTKQQIAATNKQLQDQNLTSVKKQVTEISNNLKLAVEVLSHQILFSEMLKQLGSVTPKDVILTNLSITQVQGSVDITALTASYNAATQLQVNLADPQNQIFSKADIVSISCGSSANSRYPCTVSIRALFATDNPFLFINDRGAKS